MKIRNWTRKTAIAIASQRGTVKKFNRLVASAAIGGTLLLGGAAADAAPISHAVSDASFDDRDLSGSGNYAYINNLPNYPWVSVGFADSNFNDNSWLFNSTYAPGANTPEPLSNPNSLHLADGNTSQILGDIFVSGREYTLSAWIHYNLDGNVGDNFGLRLFDGTSGNFAGADVFAEQDFVLGTDFSANGGWQQMSLTFAAGAAAHGKPIGILLGPEAQANRISVDDVSLTSIPEPGTAALLGAGSILIWQLVRRRRLEDDQA